MLISHLLAPLTLLSATAAFLSALNASSPVSLLYTFNGTKIKLENLAARSSGHLLLTSDDQANVYSYDPSKNVTSLLYTFPESRSTLGIVEAAPDVFIVVVGKYSLARARSFSVWSIDLNNYHENPIVNKITAIPEAEALNGMITIKRSPDLVLIADSFLGVIWRVNIKTGNYSKAIEHVFLTSCNSESPFGINGIQTYDEKIYFSNSAQRLPLFTGWDDFAIDWAGSGWLATHANAVTQVTLGGRQRNFTGIPDMLQPKSLVFGRGSLDAEKTLFVATEGNQTTPSQIFALDTRLIQDGV
ncbi:hypothetical protein MMC22_004396 [Lobaria immixta]|nr:hypothetical protein [Lobaria immixta]